MFAIKEALDALATPLYVARGRRPWSYGYYTTKKKTICSAIDANLFCGGAALPPGYARYIDERSVEYPWLFAQLPVHPGKILDAGSALNHSFLLKRLPLKDAELTIMTLAPEKRCFWSQSISYVFGDLRKTFFADAVFDVVVSISTIEHIGLDNTMLYTLDACKKESDAHGFIPAVVEFKRILRPGGMCLITVPYGRRGVYGWFQVFDYPLVRQIIAAFQPSEYHIEYFGYSSIGWHRAQPADIADGEFFDVHAQKGTSLPPLSCAGASSVACIKLIA